jgi:hypothetical protein
MIIKVLKVFLQAVGLIAEAVRLTVSHEIACRNSMKGKVKAVRVLAEAVGVIIEVTK